MSWELFKDHTFCINLVERPDRLRDVSADLHKIGLLEYTEFYHPLRSTISGAVGCYTSHVIVQQAARDKGLKWALILEDDLLFDEAVIREHLQKLIEYLPTFIERDDWDMLFIGHNPAAASVPIYKKDEFRVYKTCSTQTHAYIVNLESSSIKKMLDAPLPTEDIIQNGKSIYHIDCHYSDTTRQYAIYPMMVFQRPESASDNHWGIMECARKYNTPESVRIHEALVVRYPFPVSATYTTNWISHGVRIAAHKILGNLLLYPLSK